MRHGPAPIANSALAGVLLGAVLLPAIGCGSGNGGPATTPIVIAWYVDAVAGNNGNPGTEAEPFLTLTHTLSVAQDGDVVKVQPGRYDNEAFPLVVPPGVTLLGDEPGRGDHANAFTVIEGVGPSFFNMSATFQMGPRSSLVGLSIVATMPAAGAGVAVIVAEDNVEIRACTIRNAHRDAIYVSNRAGFPPVRGVAIIDNDIRDNDAGYGLILVGEIRSCRVERSGFFRNRVGVGVFCDEAPDLGGGAYGSAGGNSLAANFEMDLEVSPGFVVSARDCLWDMLPPRAHAALGPPAGVEIWVPNGGSVITDGALPVP